MDNQIELTGMVLSSMPVGDYNKRLIILTGESGKITAFARGAKKPGNKFMGSSQPFCFGKFKLIKGKEAYTLIDANISRHFEELRLDYDRTVYASYFMEIADYYTRENLEAYEELNLLYASFIALISDKFDNKLVRAVYEAKSLVIAGEYAGLTSDREYSDTVRFVYEHIGVSPIKNLYSFSVNDDALVQICDISQKMLKKATNHHFKSLELL